MPERLMKPDPRIYELATARLGVDAEDCFYIGDGADSELEGARAVGMEAVLLRPGDTDPPTDWAGRELASLGQTLSLLVARRPRACLRPRPKPNRSS